MTKKKACIITIYDENNLGNRLQNFAVQEILRNMSIDVITLKNDFRDYVPDSVFIRLKRRLLNIIHSRETNIVKNKMDCPQKELVKLRQKKFKEFNNNYIFTTDWLNNNEKLPNEFINQFDYFITGSDQVWNPYFDTTSALTFLDFPFRGKKIAFSASFGVSDIPKKRLTQYKNWINGIDSISVREQAGKDIVNKITRRQVTLLADPTMLLDHEKWLTIEKKPEWFESKDYLLTYFLGNSVNNIEYVKKIAKQYNLNVISVYDIHDANGYIVDPSEFIYLIRHAKLMITDSFHGTVFSILMKTPFIVMNREDDSISMNSRIDSLLQLTGYTSRYYPNLDQKNIFNIDFNNIDNILAIERKRGYDFLKNSFQI